MKTYVEWKEQSSLGMTGGPPAAQDLEERVNELEERVSKLEQEQGSQFKVAS